MKNRGVNISLLGILLVVLGGWGGTSFWQEKRYQEKQTRWIIQQDRLTKEGRKATIIKRVSEQMEEMAYQQKEISDQRWQEALRQKKKAEDMQQLAEKETTKALDAKVSALEAFHKAEEQKKIADEKREEALQAQLKADKLAKLALGRSLGTFAIEQYRTGDKELAELLGYYAWKYTSENGGDCYQPAVLGALALVSGSSVLCYMHKGAVRAVIGIDKGEDQKRWVSVSECGEIVVWKQKLEEWEGEELYNEPELDFRKLVWDAEKDIIYAVAWSGKLVRLGGEGYKEVVTWETGPEGVCDLILREGQLFTIYRDGTVLNEKGQEVKKEWFPFDETELKEDGQVVAVDTLRNQWAIGYENGRIIWWQNGEKKVLLGHIAAVTGLAFENNQLMSVSYDGRLNLWNFRTEKTEAVVVATLQEWLYTVSRLGELVACGGASGTLYINSISPENMAMRLKKKLKRDFTEEERAYYLNGREGGYE